MTRVVTADEPVDGTNAIIGAIFVYPVDGLPKDVRLDWDLFDERITRVPGRRDRRGRADALLPRSRRCPAPLGELPQGKHACLASSRSDPRSRTSRFRSVSASDLILAFGLLDRGWRRRSWPLGHAAVALAVLAWFVPTPSVDVPVPSRVRTPSGEEAAPTIHALLYNVYRSLDFRDEEVVFDRLAQSLSGDVLERVYLEMRKGLRLENQGGARVRVRKVELLEVIPSEAQEAGTLSYRAKWNATGSVGHWGHTHMRTNQYDATITLARIGGQWRIADIEILQEQRVIASLAPESLRPRVPEAPFYA